MLFSSMFTIDGIPDTIGVLGAQIFATKTAFLSLVPLNLAFITVEVIAIKLCFLVRQLSLFWLPQTLLYEK
jgi:hypothetical protein